MVKRYEYNPDGPPICTMQFGVEYVAADDYDALALAVYDECSRQGCFCVTDPATGECSFCKLSLALDGFVPQRTSEAPK